MLVHVLDPQLERRGDAGLERRLQPVGKCAADLLRADQVELARLRPRGRKDIASGSNSLRPRSGRHLDGRCLVDLVDRGAERPVELLVALLRGEGRTARRG